MRAWLLGVLLVSGCTKAAVPGPTDNFDRNLLLTTLEAEVITPSHRQFLAEAQTLADATAAWAQATAQGGDAVATSSSARLAWKQAMRAWQRVELLQLGPAGRSGLVTGGQSLRDEIYSWPTVNPCRVDQELVDQDYTRADYPSGELVNVYGLDALEYLVFHDAPSNSCAPQLQINQGPWAALVAEPGGLQKRRSAHAAVLAAHLVKVAQRLNDAWADDGGGFGRQYRDAGKEGSGYRSAQAAIDETFAAMFYLDLVTKDEKLGVPAGLSVDCPGEICPEELESPWANSAKEQIQANLEVFQALYLGGAPERPNAVGFDDFLIARGAPETAATIQADLAAALEIFGRMPGDLRTLLGRDRAQVVQGYEAIKKVTDELKSSFVTVLNLKVPDEGAGDND